MKKPVKKIIPWDRRKTSIYIKADIQQEMQKEAERYGVSFARIVRDSWAIAKAYAKSGRRPPAGVVLFSRKD